MRKILILIVFVLVFIISASFAAFNMSPVTVNYYFGDTTVPLSVLLVIAVLVGLALGGIVMFIISLKLRYEIHRLNQKLELSEQEVNSLRILPIKDSH